MQGNKWIWTYTVSETSTLRMDAYLVDAVRQGGLWAAPFDPNETQNSPADLIHTREVAHADVDFPVLSRTRIQGLIESGNVFVNQKVATSKTKPQLGSQIEIHIPSPTLLDLTPSSGPLEILYEDSDLIIINKEAGISVHPSETETGETIVHRILYHVKDLSSIGGVARPGIVHRIDKYTSGSLLIAKNDRSHQALTSMFANHDLTRKYWAFCAGTSTVKSFSVEGQIARHPTERKKFALMDSNGKYSKSNFKILQTYQRMNLGDYYSTSKTAFASLIEATLETGRTHQVRVHLSSRGFPLFGDSVYGASIKTRKTYKDIPLEIRESIEVLSGQALHARELSFKHPISGKLIETLAPLPKQLSILYDRLKVYGS